jgi:hypothetical protein
MLLYMMVDLKAHFLKIEKMLSKAQIKDIFECPEFKVCLSFIVCAISNLYVLVWFTRSSSHSTAVPCHTSIRH